MSKAWLPGFLALGLVWGASFLFIELALESFTAIGIAFLRGFLGAMSLLIVIVVTKQKLPRVGKHWLHIAVVALLLNTVPGFLFAVGQQYVSSAIAGILNATTPMMTLLIISLAFREQKPTLNQNLGIVLGFAGVALVGLGGGEISFTSPWGIALLLLATLCYGIAMPYAKRFVSPLPYSPYVLAAAQVSASALLAALPALLVGVTHAPVSASALWGILALGIVGTGFAYVWNYRNIELAGSVIASSVTYVTPVIAVVLGFLVLGERLTLLQAAGGVLVLVSALVVQQRLKLWPGAA
ncbi:DMT family transporter [Pontimonas sp.]|jgi:drug/metabolite transporter (DMT)-like permease|nr:DMT family transporter [Pontimonas sp.]MDA8900900.1 DMT family transporter [Pontimonas sp.]|tara:strand:- start:127 stop:1017 length:891 start_codon:yes stop_codon:yes gene_type:complete